MQRICVDMDEVMADTLAEHLSRYNQAFDEEVTPTIWPARASGRWSPPTASSSCAPSSTPRTSSRIWPSSPARRQVLEALSARFEIFIATQAMAVPNSLGPKYRWLQRHFPFIPPSNYVFCGDKSILRADYLIDDLPKNLLRFEGQGLLYTAPRNLAETAFVRVNNWPEVAAFFAAKP